MKETEVSQLNEPFLRDWFARSGDVSIQSFKYGTQTDDQQVLLMYCQGMANTDLIDKVVLPQLQSALHSTGKIDASLLNRSTTLQLEPIRDPGAIEQLTLRVYCGELVFFFKDPNLLFSLNIAKPPNRTPEESSSETSIKGPQDAFTEELSTNIALIRKRLKTRSLCCEKFTIGARSHTSVALMYIDDVIRPEFVEEARKRLNALNVDGLLTSAQLEEGLVGKGYALFPLMEYKDRPDFVAESLLRGRFTILVDGSPMAVIAPTNLMLSLKSSEDIHFPYYYVALERALRFLGFIASTFLPGFWIAVSGNNIDQIPLPLVATIASSRLGLPLSGPLDFLIMLGLFELFREAGMRLPRAVGQTVSVVGGLIVGDAAIRAGITSPTTLVVTSIATISMFTIANQSLAGTVTVLRLVTLFAAMALGVYGFMLSVMGLVLYLSTLESFGVPYLAPLSPPKFREMLPALLAKPWKSLKRRPAFLQGDDPTRRGGDTT
ncbi:spore germination protein [Paenibacillus allorhizosphaerae]|uniref:Spore germination protein XA n=1 Tax=Paenibacillus allorhizosphaerae TaxID=2849866 RepID=A0ABM8VGD2_9BACL|nr:spore germination protein [Paenibacillus allorhizosphaerae]CAG7635952.1 Spore germination protein XA [Paenibacillus allorhizosphaerae]